MTLPEFKAWFEGFTEGWNDAPPNKKQWARIKERVAEITGQSVSYPVYIDRYVAPVRPYWERVWCSNPISTLSGTATSAVGQAYSGQLSPKSGAAQGYDSCAAMNAVGKADALALKAA